MNESHVENHNVLLDNSEEIHESDSVLYRPEQSLELNENQSESNFDISPTSPTLSPRFLPIFDNDEVDGGDDIDPVRTCTEHDDSLDIIDMNRIDNVMCNYIWNDFKHQYKPFINSLFKLTNVDSQYYFSIPENREIVYNYINQRLRGVKLLKFRPIGSSYIFFTLKRINDHKIISKLDFFEKQLIEFKERLDIIQDQVTKIYNAPGMPGYIDALNNFNETMNKINRNN